MKDSRVVDTFGVERKGAPPDQLVGYEGLALFLNVSERVAEDMVLTGKITPIIRRKKAVRFHLPTVVAELRKRAGLKREHLLVFLLLFVCVVSQTGGCPRLPVAIGLSPSPQVSGAKGGERKGERAFLEQEVRSSGAIAQENPTLHCVTLVRLTLEEREELHCVTSPNEGAEA